MRGHGKPSGLPSVPMYEFQKKWWPLCSPCSAQVNMFNLMSNCCTWVSNIKEPIRKVEVLVLGLDKAGKTSSIRGMFRVPHAQWEAGPTHGCVRKELRVENYLVSLLDVGGAAEWRATWREHYGEVHGIIFVVDSSDRQRIKEVKELLADLLKQPRVAGKPILVLANKQDKMNALLGSELIEFLSLEKLVNQSRSLCHIESCSALMDLRRWSDRKTLRGLRWLLRAVSLDYPELCARVARDSKRLPAENGRRKTKEERMRSIKSELHQVHRPQEKKNKGGGELQPEAQNIPQKENMLKKRLIRKKKKQVKIKEGEKDHEGEKEQEEEGEGNERELEQSAQKASSALIPPKRGRLKRRTRVREETQDVPESHVNEHRTRVGEETQDVPESHENEEKTPKAKGEKRTKRKVVKVKRKNKINTEEMPRDYSQPADLSATFDLYRKAIMALKERQEQGRCE